MIGNLALSRIIRAALSTALLVIGVSVGGCSDNGTEISRGIEPSTVYALRREAYSPMSQLLALITLHRTQGSELVSFVTIADESKGTICHALPYDRTLDVGWVPGEEALVIARGFRMSLATRDGSHQDGYRVSAIACPEDCLYSNLAWNPQGTWLAAKCLSSWAGTTLGLYRNRPAKGDFILTDIPFGGDGRAIWRNSDTLYVPHDGVISEVSIRDGRAEMSGVVGEFQGYLHGFLGDDTVTQQDGTRVYVGKKAVATIDVDNLRRVIVTDQYLFVSASPSSLVVFGEDGNEVARTDPGHRVLFGAIGSTPATVYGLTETAVVRISLGKDGVALQDIIDLRVVPAETAIQRK